MSASRSASAVLPPRLRFAAAAAAIAALTIEIATHLLDFGLWDLRVRLLDSGYEWSWSHVVSTLAGAAGALACVRAAVGGPSRRRAWAVTASLLGVLVLDNVTRMHENVPAWPIVYGPILVALGLAIIQAVAGTSAARLAHVALALLAASLVIHVIGPHVVRLFGWDTTSWAYQVKVALKEGTELAGWVLLVPALLAASAERDASGSAAIALSHARARARRTRPRRRTA